MNLYEVKFESRIYNESGPSTFSEFTETVRAYTAEDALFQARVQLMYVCPHVFVKPHVGELRTVSVAPAVETPLTNHSMRTIVSE